MRKAKQGTLWNKGQAGTGVKNMKELLSSKV